MAVAGKDTSAFLAGLIVASFCFPVFRVDENLCIGGTVICDTEFDSIDDCWSWNVMVRRWSGRREDETREVLQGRRIVKAKLG